MGAYFSVINGLGARTDSPELLLVHGSERFNMAEFRSQVVAVSPTVVLVELANGVVCGGYSRRDWPDVTGAEYVVDSSSFLFALKPRVARFAARDGGKKTLGTRKEGFKFGCGDFIVFDDGEFTSCVSSYEGGDGRPFADDRVKVARWEVWRV
jgi:hypothetical protein